MSPKSSHFTIIADLVVLTRLGLLVASVVFRLTPAVNADVINHAEYGASVVFPESVSKGDRIISRDVVSVGSGLLQRTVGASTGSVNAFASAAPGHIGVSVAGIASVTGPGPGAVVAANATASWSEETKLTSFEPAPGTGLTVVAKVFLFGSLSATAGPLGAAHVTVTANGQQFSVLTENVVGGPINEPPPVTMPLELRIKNGTGNVLEGALSVNGLAQTGSGFAQFLGSYRTSLHWGGIDHVEDTLTGEIINDWTVTSESGLDYAHPIGFPDGDTDFDEDVDLEDLNAVRNHFGETGRFVVGDTSPYDGVVDLADLNAVRNHFGTAPNPVPEPSTLALFSVAIVGAALWRRHTSPAWLI